MDKISERDSIFPVLPLLLNLDNPVNPVYFFSVFLVTLSSVWQNDDAYESHKCRQPRHHHR